MLYFFLVTNLLVFVLLPCRHVVVESWYPNRRVEVFCNIHDYNYYVQRDGCYPEYFTIKACLGNCPSYVLPLQDVPFFQSKCQTCRATALETKRFHLRDCEDGVERRVLIDSAIYCECGEYEKCY